MGSAEGCQAWLRLLAPWTDDWKVRVCEQGMYGYYSAAVSGKGED